MQSISSAQGGQAHIDTPQPAAAASCLTEVAGQSAVQVLQAVGVSEVELVLGAVDLQGRVQQQRS